MTITVSPAVTANQSAALRLLFSRFPVEEQEGRLTEALASAAHGRLNLDGLLLATSSDQYVGAALVMIQADGTALVWPPVINCHGEDEASIESLLMDSICQWMEDHHARLGQALISPDDDVESALLTRHGFKHAANMFFLAKLLQRDDSLSDEEVSRKCPKLSNHQIETKTFAEDNSERFASVIEQSYQHSLDCPYLNDFRTGAEAIASHKLSGEFDSSRWWLYSIDGSDAGVLLLNRHPDQNAMELVYLGVVPKFRGLGLGRRMLSDAIRYSTTVSCVSFFLAVDCDNHYANSLYAEFAFAELARRRIMLRVAGIA